MCGIAGILYKHPETGHAPGQALVDMLDGCQHRGPDSTGFADVAIVHNGQITNYWKMRRRLERRGFEFTTDNDSELIAVYLADKLSLGVPLKEALKMSIDDLDGTFSFLVSTKDEIGYAKDRLAAKPMIMYENDDLIAIASEEVSLNRLFPGQALDTREPPPGSYDTWSRST
jgi:glutamine phosphoribosylpyrophosphate amidotransferase